MTENEREDMRKTTSDIRKFFEGKAVTQNKEVSQNLGKSNVVYPNIRRLGMPACQGGLLGEEGTELHQMLSVDWEESGIRLMMVGMFRQGPSMEEAGRVWLLARCEEGDGTTAVRR